MTRSSLPGMGTWNPLAVRTFLECFWLPAELLWHFQVSVPRWLLVVPLLHTALQRLANSDPVALIHPTAPRHCWAGSRI